MTAPARLASVPTDQVPRAYVPPTVSRAPRGRALALSFLALVLMPLGALALYLVHFAAPQYESTVGFSVRRAETFMPLEMFGGLTGLPGGTSSDADVLYAFLDSQELAESLEANVGLRAAYEVAWPDDPVFSLAPDTTIEDLLVHWRRMSTVSFDPKTGIIELKVWAFDPDTAQQIAAEVFAISSDLVNRLSEEAEEDTLGEAQVVLDLAAQRLADARTALTAFRAESQIVDPGADLGGRMGLLAHLEEELANELIRLDLLRTQTNANDPRIERSTERISVIEARIADERLKLGDGSGVPEEREDYAGVVATFERLTVEVEFAQEAYLAARAALDTAQAEARRQSRYLAAHVRPTRAGQATGPDPLILLGVGALALMLVWGVLALLVASLRERA
ncbi:MAG: sugar transporter [Pseudomonadota bacterium]